MPKQKIRIISDSVTDIPADLLEKWDIPVVPCYVNFEGNSYLDDGVELDRTEYFQRVLEMDEFPTTAAPGVGLAEEIMREALEGYDHMVSINVASSLSATFNNVRLAAKNIDETRITVLDSESVSMGQGWQVLAAAETAAETGDVEAVKAAVESVRKRQTVYAAIDNIEYLRRSGRISSVIASLGTVLKIKPIVKVIEQGEVQAAHRVRTFKRAKDKLIDLLRTEGELDRLAIIHTQHEEGAYELQEMMGDLVPPRTIIASVGPTLGTHIGVGSLGFVSVRKQP